MKKVEQTDAIFEQLKKTHETCKEIAKMKFVTPLGIYDVRGMKLTYLSLIRR